MRWVFDKAQARAAEFGIQVGAGCCSCAAGCRAADAAKDVGKGLASQSQSPPPHVGTLGDTPLLHCCTAVLLY